jgi:putative SOS response-associated peptidase YedK
MCGRFALTTSGATLAEEFEVDTTSTKMMSALGPRYNIAPTQPVVAVRLEPKSGERELVFFQWGFIPAWAKDPKIGARMINARSESVAEKPAFRAAFKRRRCLIPADGFYEWQRQDGKKQPLYIHSSNNHVFAFAGLWETWQGADGSEIDSCTILTTEANDLVRPIHDRMPVIIEPDDYNLWLEPDPDPKQAYHLLRPYPAEKMAVYPVSTRVNSPKYDDLECIAPLP